MIELDGNDDDDDDNHYKNHDKHDNHLHSGFEHLLRGEENLVWLVAIAVNIPG